jgi:hypothetical protein
MYFKKTEDGVYHILYYQDSGTAPPPCGVRAAWYDLKRLKEGLPTPNIVEEVPADAALCKHCEAATRKQTYGSGV